MLCMIVYNLDWSQLPNLFLYFIKKTLMRTNSQKWLILLKIMTHLEILDILHSGKSF